MCPIYSIDGAAAADSSTHLTSSIPGAFYGDMELMRSTQSVKLFSSCLVAVCTMQLLLLMLKLLGSFSDDGSGSVDDDGNGGTTPVPPDTPPSDQPVNKDNNIEDSSGLFFMQVLMNTLGLYVGLIGVRSANTLQLATARAYFYGLIVVGTMWLALRFVWAIQSVDLGYDAETGPPQGGGGNGGSGDGTGAGGDGDGTGEQLTMSKSELVYMVSLSLMIYLSVWSVCFLRASQFYNALRRLEGETTR